MSNLILQQMRSFSLHYSTDCNMNCKYCYIDQDNKLHTEENKKIREAILNGTFIKNIIDLYQQVPEQKMNIESYSLWGAEPTINGDLFYLVHAPLLDFFPNIVFFDFSTNGLVGGKFIYKNFVIPMLEYAETHKRKLTFQIQFSLDGPPELNDKTRQQGATKQTIQTMKEFIELIPNSQFLDIELACKATWNIDTFREYNNLSKLQAYYDWCDTFIYDIITIANQKKNIITDTLCFSPTCANPTLATKEDGEIFANWLNLLSQIDTSHYKFYNTHSLFFNGFSSIQQIAQYRIKNLTKLYEATSCSAGINDYSINYKGEFAFCHQISGFINSKKQEEKYFYNLFSTNNPSDNHYPLRFYDHMIYLDAKYKLFQTEVVALASVNQINKKYIQSQDESFLLWYLCTKNNCIISSTYVTTNIFLIPFGGIRFWGNGAAEALIKFYQHEILRGIR